MREYHYAFLIEDGLVNFNQLMAEYLHNVAEVSANVKFVHAQVLPCLVEVLGDVLVGTLDRLEVGEVLEEKLGGLR